MLEEILQNINNWFVVDIHDGHFKVENNQLSLPFLRNGQYFRVFGSVFSDGLHQYPCAMENEEFDGVIWALAVPEVIINLSEEIKAWQAKNAESPFQSESFGGYSYTKASDGNGGSANWQSAFRGRLNAWRKL